MTFNIPFKLLEINVLSAQNLPPVSKMLRTFVVAWINPDHKLSTRIDHQGHTNPTWNYKLVFKVDERFLRNEAATITIEIYNVAWLRDLPIGTTRLLINYLSPPLVRNNPVKRSVVLHICRPSGHLQGILNLGINLLDDSIPITSTGSELNAFTGPNFNHGMMDDTSVQEHSPMVEDNEDREKPKNMKRDLKSGTQPSISSKVMPYDEDIHNTMRVCSKLGNLSVLEIQPKPVASNGSVLSFMKPLPSEVAANLKKGVYSTAGDDFGSSIFENWTEPGESCDGLRSQSVKWHVDDQTPLTKEFDDQKVRPKRRRNSDGGGLFSCFGKGFEFTFICGSNSMKKNKKKMHHHQKFHTPSGGNMHRFY